MGKKTESILYAFRSKLNGNFFKWEELADDGWGYYFATVSEEDMRTGEMPFMSTSASFNLTSFRTRQRGKYIFGVMDSGSYMKEDEIEVVAVKVSF